jgi:phage tail tape-measure protein
MFCMRNFLYNKSDIFVAVLIVVVAAVIIWFRVDAIMAYPSAGTPDTELGSSVNTAGTENITASAITSGGAVASGTAIEGTAAAITNDTVQPTEEIPPVEAPLAEPPPPPPPATPVRFEVRAGEASSTIAQNLQSAGLVASAQDFINVAQSAGKITALRAGVFEIPPGASVDEIVRILTGS